MHLLASDFSHLAFAFACVDDGDAVSDAIGYIFDAALLALRPLQPLRLPDRFADRAFELRALDHRLHIGTTWATVHFDIVPVTIFGAGAGTTRAAAARSSRQRGR
ncbi:hypothetical protein ACQP1O_17445 [Nocardia sp. CA-151230]|uniref:hypothetical protein n=1 Tax=Nocardia sp. CA-151230 TaxID=3239982 RepID=UPI003D94DAF4